MPERQLSALVVKALRDAERRPPAAGSAERPMPLPAGDDAQVPGGIDELAAAAARGNTEAVGQLYDALVGPIFRYVAVRVHRREDAEGLTQLVF
ncbi:MAG TPA: hypothetical protein VHK28_06740, partial [Candidatus Limnocylindria bacterium]|nr:hypothetical protein [Candidatus Limnocylindria bacterium]